MARIMTRGLSMTGTLSRRDLIRTGAVAAGGLLASSWAPSVRAAPVNIRYATGGGIGPNEMETFIWLDYLKSNVLKNYGKVYTLDMTFTRGSPEAAQLLAAGQVDLAALSSPAFATTIAKDAIPDGISIISDIYQDGHPGFATNTFFVLKDSPIKTVADLKGKKVAINAFGSAVDLVLRVALKKGRARSAARSADRRGHLPQYRARDPRRAAWTAACWSSRSCRRELPRATCGHCSPAAIRSGPLPSCSRSPPTSSFASSRTRCGRSWRISCQGLAWYYDPANREKALELVRD